jgi:hypothetical protein
MLCLIMLLYCAKKADFIDHFKDFILPFWEDEVTRVFVGGKAKSFNVYLVD